MNSVIIDTNLLLLLLVGSASKQYIKAHRRLVNKYDESDFELIGIFLSTYSEIITLPHILAETSNLARQITNPARSQIQSKLRIFAQTATEIPVESLLGVCRSDFDRFGLTDSVILQLCSSVGTCTLLTDDAPLADWAQSLGYSVVRYSDALKLSANP